MLYFSEKMIILTKFFKNQVFYMSSNKTIHIQVSGMSCGGCTNFVKNTIQNLEGIESTIVSLENAEATVVFNSKKIAAQQIIDALNETHFEVVGSR